MQKKGGNKKKNHVTDFTPYAKINSKWPYIPM